jgi:hypothetical protein
MEQGGRCGARAGQEGRKIKQTNPPDWTGTGTDLS